MNYYPLLASIIVLAVIAAFRYKGRSAPQKAPEGPYNAAATRGPLPMAHNRSRATLRLYARRAVPIV